MSFIFKKLSVILCCLFGLIFINPVILAGPPEPETDYLIYFLNDEQSDKKCYYCGQTLRCSNLEKSKIAQELQLSKLESYPELESRSFCFLEYTYHIDADTVFEKQNPYCLGCVLSRELLQKTKCCLYSNIASLTKDDLQHILENLKCFKQLKEMYGNDEYPKDCSHNNAKNTDIKNGDEVHKREDEFRRCYAQDSIDKIRTEVRMDESKDHTDRICEFLFDNIISKTYIHGIHIPGIHTPGIHIPGIYIPGIYKK